MRANLTRRATGSRMPGMKTYTKCHVPHRGVHSSVAIALLTLLGIALFSCASVRTVAPGDGPPPLPENAAHLAFVGHTSYGVEQGELPGKYGCTLVYEFYRPVEPATEVVVFLGHGFMRNLALMRDWAAIWASYGVPTVVVTFCNSNLFSGNHDRNAADLRELARALHDGPVIYAGFSAGGLSAYLAAAQDPRAAAFLGLDPVDSGNLASIAAATLSVPALFLVGEPSSCNSKNNILKALPSEARVVRITNAAHCHFENPYDPGCEGLCGKVQPTDASDEILYSIRSLATSWILTRTGALPEASAILDGALAVSPGWERRVTVVR